MEILPQTRLMELLEEHPELEEAIQWMAPPFRNLRNPVLRRTVGRVATLAKVAQVGGMEPTEFVNALRAMLAQPELGAPTDAAASWPDGTTPDWAAGEPQCVADASELLARREVPLTEVSRLARELEEGRHLVVLSEFEPVPLAEALRKAGYRAQSVRNTNDQSGFQTFVARGERC